MFMILGAFAIVLFMLIIGYIGELITGSGAKEFDEDSEEFKELSTGNILNQLK